MGKRSQRRDSQVLSGIRTKTVNADRIDAKLALQQEVLGWLIAARSEHGHFVD